MRRKQITSCFLMTLLLITCLFIGTKKAAYAAGNNYTMHVYTAAECGSELYAAQCNTRELNSYLEGNESKTITIPSGSTVYLAYTLRLYSNTTIIANGAKIIQTGWNDGNVKCGVISNRVNAVNYSSLKNVTFQGGTWTTINTNTGSSIIRIAHASNVNFYNVTVSPTYTGHGIELIGCRNCLIKNSNVYCIGNKVAGCGEEAIQIDIAEVHTAPGICNESGAAYCNGATCNNIVVDHCKVHGSRGIGVNFAGRGTKAMKNRFHNNITVSNCNIIGETAEALTIYNTVNAKVTNNTLISNSKKKSGKKYTSYTLGLNVTIQGTNSAASKGTITITNNKCKGARNGMQVVSLTKSKYKSVICKKNTCYARTGAKNAINISKSATKKKTVSGNKSKKW